MIKTTALSYNYSKSGKALSGIHLEIKRGSIYGFLGPNGSGKTTTLRLLLGLLPVQEGSIELFGQSLLSDRTAILKRIGSLIEAPSLYGHLTAHENLQVYRSLYGSPRQRIHEVLHLTGLSEAGKKLVKTYSLGMKQRLAIALALLPQPDLLILDEPANGLDPAGIIELRRLIRQLNKMYGMTILISSHLLSEIEKMVTHIGIISKGKILFQGTVEELQTMQQKQRVMEVNTSDNDLAWELLQQYRPEKTWRELLVPFGTMEDVAAINKILTSHHLHVYRLQPKENNLEQLFIELTTPQL